MNKLTIKLLVWHGAVLILTLMFWGYGSHVSSEVLFGKGFDALAVLYLILLTAVMTMGIALFQRKIWTLTLSGIVGVIYLLQFGFTELNVLGAGIFLLFGLYSRERSKDEISQRIKITMRRAVQTGAWPIVMGLFVLISFAVYQSPFAEELEKAEKLPSVSENFIRSVVEQTVGRQMPVKNETEKQSIISQISDETFREINTFLKPYFKYTPPILAFGLFLILSGLSFIFVAFSTVVAVGLFWILKKTGVVRIEERDMKAEILII